jgi:protein-histidine pros-kinase
LPGPLTADQEKQLKTIRSSGGHLLSLINDLLDLAKIESGKVELNVQQIVCQEVVDEVITSLLPLAQAKNLEFKARFGGQATLALRTDRRAFRQILINLASNGIKFTDTGSVTVELSRSQANGRAMTAISVVDTGIGIKPEDQTRLFQAFEQVHSGRRTEGTGLGLHLCSKLAGLIQGRIEFESEYGKGSRFTLLLPEIFVADPLSRQARA